MKVVVGITGASGVIYGLRLVEELFNRGNHVITVVSASGLMLIEYEAPGKLDFLKENSSEFYESDDFNAPIVSGSFEYDSMVVCPCSMKTLAAISSGYAANVITRAADCALKEKRKLILVVRETPLNTIQLGNMLRVAKAGATILPASPGFYHQPKDIKELVDFIVGKVLDQLGIENNLYKRWKA